MLIQHIKLNTVSGDHRGGGGGGGGETSILCHTKRLSLLRVV